LRELCFLVVIIKKNLVGSLVDGLREERCKRKYFYH